MSGNPNMQKIGKRKAPAGTQNPKWLFPSSSEKSTPTSSSSAPLLPQKSKAKEEKKLADDLLKRRAAGEAAKPEPPAQLVDLVPSPPRTNLQFNL